MKKALLAGLTASLAFAFSGCQDSVNILENKDKHMAPQYIQSEKVLTDRILDARLKLLRVDTQNLADSNLMKIQVTMKSMTGNPWTWWYHGDDPYKIDYHFTWLDKNGMEVRTATAAWKEMDILPGDTFRIQGIAPSPNCKDFELKLKQHTE